MRYILIFHDFFCDVSSCANCANLLENVALLGIFANLQIRRRLQSTFNLLIKSFVVSSLKNDWARNALKKLKLKYGGRPIRVCFSSIFTQSSITCRIAKNSLCSSLRYSSNILSFPKSKLKSGCAPHRISVILFMAVPLFLFFVHKLLYTVSAFFYFFRLLKLALYNERN